MKRWIPFIAICLVVIFIGGLLAGSVSEAGNQIARWNARMNTQSMIAVVNADVGVMVDGERLNYSAAIIEALDEEFVQASPALASTGLVEGTFGAVITFPSDVSERILSFNEVEPRRVQIEFQINPNLPEQEYIEVYLRILNLQMAINSTLAYTYVSSIFGEFHSAQDQIRHVFANNETNLDAMNVIQLQNFTGSLNLDYIPEIPFEPAGFDGTGHFGSVEGFAAHVAELYLSSYRAAAASYLTMREGMLEMTTDIPQLANDWLDRLDFWAGEWEEFGAIQRKFEEMLIIYHEELDEYNAELQYAHHYIFNPQIEEASEYFLELEAWYENLRENEGELQWYEIELYEHYDGVRMNLNEQIDLSNQYVVDLTTWHNRLTTYRDDLMDWFDLPYWYDDLETNRNNLQAQINAIPPMPMMPNITNPALTPEQITNIVQGHQNAVNEWVTQMEQITINLGGLLDDLDNYLDLTLPNNILANAPPALNQQRATPVLVAPLPQRDEFELEWLEPVIKRSLELNPFVFTVPESPEETGAQQPEENSPASAEGFLEPLAHMRGQLETFNIEDFMTDDLWSGVDSQLGGFGSYLDFIRDGLALHAEGNNMQLSMIFFEYTSYLMGMRQEAFAAEMREMENLRNTLDVFYGIQDGTRADTAKRLGTFSNMMPDTRRADGVNRALVNYTIAPFEFVPPVLRADIDENEFNHNTLEETFMGYMRIGIPILLVVFLLTLASYLFPFAKLKQKKME